jgi:DNA polymerase-4
VRDQPVLRGQPVAVGGAPDRRGVVATCNYEAREYGVRSAMASAYAKKICPNLVIVKPNFEKYRLVSKKIHEIFNEYTSIIEPLSLDEAYLDVSNSTACQGSATLMAKEIRAKVEKQLGITISAGIAPNKFIAKIASDWNKPNGQYVVLPNQVDEFVAKLQVSKLFGVGQVTTRKLNLMGIETCGDLRTLSVIELTKYFGTFGERLYHLCRGEDDRPVKTDRRRKSISVENTYEDDLITAQQCVDALSALYEDFCRRLERVDDDYQITKAFIKLKFSDFTLTTLERLCDKPDVSVYEELCVQAFERGQGKGVRLLGVGVRFRDLAHGATQLDFFIR